LSKGDGTVLRDTQHGLTLGELGIQSHEIMSAEKLQIVEDIPKAPLLGPDGRMTEKVTKIFNEWFDMYSNENDKMTKETCALFIYGCTGEKPTLSDDRIGNLFKAYDKNNDGFIERSEFLEFYLKACKDKEETVRDNMKHHNIRADLKKLSEIQEEVSF
jgi:EF hand